MRGTVKELTVLRGEVLELVERRLAMVIVSEGYRDDELEVFHRDADAAVATITSAAPFDAMPIWIARLDVASKESSAYRSAVGGVESYFRARFTGDSRHLLELDEDLVLETVAAALPCSARVDKILVLVNAPEVFGGGGRPPAADQSIGLAVVSNANGNVTLLHELGHAFGLADEYDDSPLPEIRPNVATSLANIPWNTFLTPGVELPTTRHDDAVIGAYPSHSEPVRYRPQYSCIMKTSSSLDHYCKVCREWISMTPKQKEPVMTKPNRDADRNLRATPAEPRDEPGGSTQVGGTNPKPPPNCGVPGTPPCPPPDVFLETRAKVIDRLAGDNPTTERRQSITAQVDTYLQAALQSTFVLLQGALAEAGDNSPSRPRE